MTAADDTTGRRAPRVLVIDDEDYVAALIASALQTEGYTVHVAYNGRDGLALAQSEPVDLVILDIMMPHLNGLALVDELRELETTRGLPIILISAGARPRSQSPKIRFLPKPFNVDHLLDLVAESLGRAS